MKILIQRVKTAACIVDGCTTGAIGAGLLLFVSFNKADTPELLPKMARKVAHLRIFEDAEGKMNLSLKDTNPQVLSIPQFTLEAKTKKGHRPSFTEAMPPDKATEYYETFNAYLEREGISVETGAFQAHMDIKLTNDGPVTIILERTNAHD